MALALSALLNACFASNVTATVEFANDNWNCAVADCSSHVQEGQYQPNYQCAEFVARSLAAGIGPWPFISSISVETPDSGVLC